MCFWAFLLFLTFFRIPLHSNHYLLSATFSNFKADKKRVFKSIFGYISVFLALLLSILSIFWTYNNRDFYFFSLQNVELCDFNLELRFIIRAIFSTLLVDSKCFFNSFSKMGKNAQNHTYYDFLFYIDFSLFKLISSFLNKWKSVWKVILSFCKLISSFLLFFHFLNRFPFYE